MRLHLATKRLDGAGLGCGQFDEPILNLSDLESPKVEWALRHPLVPCCSPRSKVAPDVRDEAIGIDTLIDRDSNTSIDILSAQHSPQKRAHCSLWPWKTSALLSLEVLKGLGGVSVRFGVLVLFAGPVKVRLRWVEIVVWEIRMLIPRDLMRISVSLPNHDIRIVLHLVPLCFSLETLRLSPMRLRTHIIGVRTPSARTAHQDETHARGHQEFFHAHESCNPHAVPIG